MFATLVALVPRLLLFRAGPQDLPYAPSLTPGLIAFVILANLLVTGQLLPLPLVMLMAALGVGAIALVTRGFLRSRNLANRYNQTFNALLLAGGTLLLLMAPLFTFAVPMLEAITANPELLQQREALSSVQPPMLVNLLLDILFFWNLAVMAHIFRQAGDMRLGGGLLMALLLLMFMFFTVMFGTALLGGLFGLDPGPLPSAGTPASPNAPAL
jgi:hypothetical protein